MPSASLALVRGLSGLLSDRSGTMLVGYSSFMLLVAIGALTVLTQIRGGENTLPDTPAISTN
ncbi:MAG: hypothetical protein Q8M19_02910 [Reyranella sp.]|nr:hypothetical protein [Reyranella sp.]